jgi:uncharacterized membrane protein YdcZ (DUF606 family)
VAGRGLRRVRRAHDHGHGAAIGVAAVVALLIAGQLAMGALIDRFGWFGVDKVALGATRLAGHALLAVGTALVLRK